MHRYNSNNSTDSIDNTRNTIISLKIEDEPINLQENIFYDNPNNGFDSSDFSNLL